MRPKGSTAGSAAILALCVWSAPARATLDASNSHATAIARFTADEGGPVVTSFPDHVSLTLSATASEAFVPPFGPWSGQFEYDASVVGSGTIAYGSANGTLEMEASTMPDVLAPTNPGPPATNEGLSEVSASMQLLFQEDALVTGGAPGTPVTLSVNFLLQSQATLDGGHPNFERSALAQFRGRIIDENTGSSVERDLAVEDLASAEFDTAVGHVLSIEGRLTLAGRGKAGRTTGSFGFFPEFLGSLDVSVGGLWITGPAGVQLDAPSGHDYAVPVPEPDRSLLLLASAGSLLVLRAFARRS
jgi:hypothetical protein